MARRWGPIGTLALSVWLQGCHHKKEVPTPPKPPPLPSGKLVAGLQAFNWDGLSNRSRLFEALRPRAKEFADAGFSHVWLPPPSQGAAKEGYLPGEWYSIVNGADLSAFTAELVQHGATAVCDLVLNHRTGTSKAPCNGKYLEFTKPEWDSQAVVCDDQAETDDGTCSGAALECSGGCKCGAKDTGANLCGSPDVDHTSRQVREDVVAFMQWLRRYYHFGGWRFDMVRGYGAGFVKEYVARGGDGGLAVGEFLDLDVEKIKAWVSASGQPAFDFPQRTALKEVAASGDFAKLASPPGLAGWSALAAHSMLDDHDTARPSGEGTGGDGGFGDVTAQLLGYVYILTHPPFPWVFLQHLDGANGAAIRQLVAARQAAEISPQDGLRVLSARRGLYAAVVGAEGNCSGKLAVRMGDESAWTPCGQGWQPAAAGAGWAVWQQGTLGITV